MSRLAGRISYTGGGGNSNAQSSKNAQEEPAVGRPGKPRGRGANYTVPAMRQEQQKSERSEKPRKRTEKIENVTPSEELLDLEDIIAQISDMNVRSDRSAVQIKRNILGSKDLIETMDDSEWQKVCEAMISTALEHGEPEFISDLIVALFQNEIFSAVLSDELMASSSRHVIENNEKPLPALLSAILCAHWPRQFAKAFDTVNPILYTIVCIIKGWILVVNEDTENYYTDEKKTDTTADDKTEQEKIVEDPKVVNKCAVALCDLCDSAQRQLWINWMSVTDEIYQCVKPAITHNPNIEGANKTRLLNTFLQINQWTKSRTPALKHCTTQTVSQ